MGQLHLFVVGMRCRRCVREVTARLRDIPGVDTVSANPADGSVRLTGSMRYDDVLAALAGTEYDAHDETVHGDHRVGLHSGETESRPPKT